MIWWRATWPCLGLPVGAWPPSNLTGPTLPAVTFDGVTVEDAFNQLVDLSGNWVYRLNPTGQIIWFGPGHRVEGTIFSAANRNILGPLTWTKSRVQHANRVMVRYGNGLVGTGQTFTGDGTKIRFPLTWPVAQVGHLTYQGVPSPTGHVGDRARRPRCGHAAAVVRRHGHPRARAQHWEGDPWWRGRPAKGG